MRSEPGRFRGSSVDGGRAESCSQEMFRPLSVRRGEGEGACKQPSLLPSCQAWLLPPQPLSSLWPSGF